MSGVVSAVSAAAASIGIGTAATTVGATAAEVAAAGTAEGITWGAASGLAETASVLANVGGAVGAVGSIASGMGQAKAAKTNAKIQEANAQISQNNAQYAGEVGEVNASKAEMKTRQDMGSVIASQSASGVDVNSGSSPQVQESIAQTGQLDALTVRSNAARQAYGYQTQAAGQVMQAGLDKNEASNDMIGAGINSATTFLGSQMTADNNYSKYLSSGGSPFSGGGGWVL